MLERLKTLFFPLSAISPPAPSVDLLQYGVPDFDPDTEVCETVLSDVPDSEFHGAAFIIRYMRADGEVSDRRVKISQIKRIGDQGYMQCYCYERCAPRMFRISEIDFLCDPETGEILSEDPRAFFSEAVATTAHIRRRGASFYSEAFELLGSGIRALVYLARVDGHFHREELDLIRRYCEAVLLREPRVVPYDEDSFLDYARKQYPDFDDFARVLERMFQRETDIALFLRFAQQLIAADGHILCDEIVALNELQQILGECEAQETKAWAR